MRLGIKAYFTAFKFGTTCLQDFISCLKETLAKNSRPIELSEWVDSWLTKAGVNELTAVIEHKSYNDTYSVHVQQKYPTSGDRIYHSQVLDIAFYDARGNQRIVSNVKI